MNMQRKTVTSLIVLILLVAMTATTVGAATATMSIVNPLFTPVAPYDTSFDLNLTVSGFSTGVTVAEAFITYDPTMVRLKTAYQLNNFFNSPNLVMNEVTDNVSFPDECPATMGTTPYAVKCVHTLIGGDEMLDGAGTAMHYVFTALQSGDACFNIFYGSMAEPVAGGAVSPTLGGQVCITLDVPVPGISGTILRQGAAGVNQDCTDVSDYMVALQSTYETLETGGSFSFLPVTAGTHYLIASYPGYLSARTSTFSVTDDFPVTTTTLRGGDVNGDTYINILDVGIIIGRWGEAATSIGSSATRTLASPAACPISDDSADVNDDGFVNIGDLAIVVGNWAMIGPTTWTP